MSAKSTKRQLHELLKPSTTEPTEPTEVARAILDRLSEIMIENFDETLCETYDSFLANAIRFAIAAERERCAGIAEQWLIANLENEPNAPGTMVGQHLTARNVAAAIREGKPQ